MCIFRTVFLKTERNNVRLSNPSAERLRPPFGDPRAQRPHPRRQEHMVARRQGRALSKAGETRAENDRLARRRYSRTDRTLGPLDDGQSSTQRAPRQAATQLQCSRSRQGDRRDAWNGAPLAQGRTRSRCWRLPPIFRGVDIIAFFKRRKATASGHADPAACIAFAVKSAKTPAFDEVEFWPDGPKLGTLRGLCPDCTATMNSRASLAKLRAVGGRSDHRN